MAAAEPAMTAANMPGNPEALARTCIELATVVAQGSVLCGLVGSAGSGKTSVLRIIAASCANRTAAIRYPGQDCDPGTEVDLVDDIDEEALARLAAAPEFRGARVLALLPGALHAFSDLFPNGRVVRVRPMTAADGLMAMEAYARQNALPRDAISPRAAALLQERSSGHPFRLNQLLQQAHAAARERASVQISADHVEKAVRKLGVTAGWHGSGDGRRSAPHAAPANVSATPAEAPRNRSVPVPLGPTAQQSLLKGAWWLAAASAFAVAAAFGAYRWMPGWDGIGREWVGVPGPAHGNLVTPPLPNPGTGRREPPVSVTLWADAAVPRSVPAPPPDQPVSPTGTASATPPMAAAQPAPPVAAENEPGRAAADQAVPAAETPALQAPDGYAGASPPEAGSPLPEHGERSSDAPGAGAAAPPGHAATPESPTVETASVPQPPASPDSPDVPAPPSGTSSAAPVSTFLVPAEPGSPVPAEASQVRTGTAATAPAGEAVSPPPPNAAPPSPEPAAGTRMPDPSQPARPAATLVQPPAPRPGGPGNPHEAARLLVLGKALLAIGQTRDATELLKAAADMGNAEAATLAAASNAKPTRAEPGTAPRNSRTSQARNPAAEATALPAASPGRPGARPQ